MTTEQKEVLLYREDMPGPYRDMNPGWASDNELAVSVRPETDWEYTYKACEIKAERKKDQGLSKTPKVIKELIMAMGALVPDNRQDSKSHWVLVIEKCFEMAERGSLDHAKFLVERAEGKVPVAVTGRDGGAFEITVVRDT